MGVRAFFGGTRGINSQWSNFKPFGMCLMASQACFSINRFTHCLGIERTLHALVESSCTHVLIKTPERLNLCEKYFANECTLFVN